MLGQTYFYLLDYVTQAEISRSTIGKKINKNKNWNYKMYPCVSYFSDFAQLCIMNKLSISEPQI